MIKKKTARPKPPKKQKRPKAKTIPANRRINPKKAGKFAVDQLYYLAGCACFAASINMLAVPNKIAQSGIAGIAVIVNQLTGFPVGLMNLAINIPLLVVALIVFGWRFVSKTAFVTLEFSLAIDLMARYVSWTYTGDRLLATVFCGALHGFGLALVFLRGASSGGMDIIGWLVRKRWPHISLGSIMRVAYVAVVLANAAVFRDLNAALYAAISVFISTKVIDSMLYGQNTGKMFYIFSQDKAEEIAREIIERLGRGVTILPGKGMYTGESRELVLCVVHRNQVSPLRRLVKELDPNSFLVIAEAQEVFGQGFRDA